MKNKYGQVAFVCVVVFITYLMMLVVISWMADITLAVNTTLNATSNMSNYPGTSEFLLSIPWILFFVPGVLGIAAVVVILRQPSQG